jgi:hypothetical protein
MTRDGGLLAIEGMNMLTRRGAAVAGAGLAALAAGTAEAAGGGAATPLELKARLAKLSYRRDYDSVPNIPASPDLWDEAAIREVLAYRGNPKQVWDNQYLNSPWVHYMRNALNGQAISFGQADFLTVSMTRGDAQLALFDQAMWDKYQLAKLTGGKMAANTLIQPQGGAVEMHNFPGSSESYSALDETIPGLMKRGAVFLSCHNAIWAAAQRSMVNANPDNKSLEQVCAELTNHLLPGVILTPGALGTLPLFQQAGFHYVT